jgi:competence protein ComEA
MSPTSPPEPGGADWTCGAAKWCAIGVLGALCAWGMVWATWLSPARVAVERGGPTLEVPASAVAPRGGAPRWAAEPAGVERPGGAGSSMGDRPVRGPARLNLNTATRLELESLPGIGPALAERILEVRGRMGRFTSVEQLELVPGIGPRRMDQIRPLVRVE